MFNERYLTKNSEETFELGKKLANYVKSSYGFVMPVIGYTGDLGAGKTVFTKGFVSQFIPVAEVCSPTYTIMNDYSDENTKIIHVDLYRIKRIEELLGTGFFEFIEDRRVIMLIEWFERFPEGQKSLLKNLITVDIKNLNDTERDIHIKERRTNNE